MSEIGRQITKATKGVPKMAISVLLGVMLFGLYSRL